MPTKAAAARGPAAWDRVARDLAAVLAALRGKSRRVVQVQNPRMAIGRFDLIVSALAIHHLPDSRKRALFAEAFALLTPGGVFYDLDCVSSQVTYWK